MNTDARATNPADTTLAPTLCCYEGCDCVAVTTDAEGDDCCVECAAKQESWVIIERFGRWIDADFAAELTSAMDALGFDVEIREPRRGEIEGTFMRNDRGDLVSIRHTESSVAEHFKFVLEREHDKLI